MRNLVLKNLTSQDKKRRIIASWEIMDQQGVRSIIQRHFICIVKEIKENNLRPSLPSVYILKERNHKEQREKFLCRIKGSILVINNGKLLQFLYMHSLKINLTPTPQDSINYS